MDTKFELQVETKAYTLDFESNGPYHQIQHGGSRHFAETKTNNSVNFRLIPIKLHK
jgi:hypothetical protein